MNVNNNNNNNNNTNNSDNIINTRQLRSLKEDIEIIDYIQLYTVKGKGNEYTVSLDKVNNTVKCTCPDYYNRKIECKHIIFCKQIGHESNRLECPYKDKCTRKNLFHFVECTHNPK